jgi:hypothetical protein
VVRKERDDILELCGAHALRIKGSGLKRRTKTDSHLAVIDRVEVCEQIDHRRLEEATFRNRC